MFERAIATAAKAAKAAKADVSIVTTGDLASTRRLALRHLPSDRLVIRAQVGADFTERYRGAFEAEFAAGKQQVVVIGSDTPELSEDDLCGAFASLERSSNRSDAQPSAVIGPSLDGGYYLLGLSRFSVAPFVGVRFGGDDVATTTAAALGAEGYTLHQLPPLLDLDGAKDARALLRRLRGANRKSDAALTGALQRLLSFTDTELHGAADELVLFQLLRPSFARGPPASF